MESKWIKITDWRCFIMMALNFQAAKHKKMLMERTKNCTVRIGDVSKLYPEGSIVWMTAGKKGEPKHKLYPAYLDKVMVKTMGTLTSHDLDHQNPEINSKEELVKDFEHIYQRRILMEDTVTVIYFTEVHEDL
jgi:hypothetical protein